MPDFNQIFRQAYDSDTMLVEAACARDTVLSFARSVATGLADDPKRLHCRFLYDAEGSRLFEAITEQPEYYPTRTEAAILARHAHDIRAMTGPVTLVELGSGYSVKTELLLSAYSSDDTEVDYVPVDVSVHALREAGRSIADSFPEVNFTGISGTYASAFPVFQELSPQMVLFLGSTLGNFTDVEYEAFWRSIAEHLPAGDHFLLGVDLVKDATTLEAAYNDAAGVTARFTTNYFARMNRELGSELDLDEIEHIARWNAEREQMEISARFNATQQVRVEPTGQEFQVHEGEEVRVEISRKFRLSALTEDLARFGFRLRRAFTDDNEWFGMLLLQRTGNRDGAAPKPAVSADRRPATDRDELLRRYRQVRSTTEALCEPLEPEDMVVQTMPDVSPTKWHLAHVTWFFETLVLARSGAPYQPFDRRFDALFNSYYQSLGKPYPRPRRGLLSRPTVREVLGYRQHVDRAIAGLLERGSDAAVERVAPILAVGLQHEQQHQELLLMDIKHVLAQNPLRPAYQHQLDRPDQPASASHWVAFEGGVVEVGATGDAFAYDNERPRHRVFLAPFELASRLVTAGEYAEFIADGGYQRPEFWLADGWDRCNREGWRAPLYWERGASGFRVLTLGGMRDVDPGEPVCHVSFFEASAYAAWAGCRLPTESEWEHAAAGQPLTGTFLESGTLHPTPHAGGDESTGLAQLFGDAWEWTSSPYAPYPGYEPFADELGEYNGKFMINQMVLRGGCCVTPGDHVRPTYRNFYYPHQRWMFAGIRLAR